MISSKPTLCHSNVRCWLFSAHYYFRFDFKCLCHLPRFFQELQQPEIPCNDLQVISRATNQFVRLWCLRASVILPRKRFFVKMNIFFEVACVVHILYFMTLFSAMFVIDAVKIDCIKSDECSCKTKTKPQQEISLWTIKNPGTDIPSAIGSTWRYNISLCHGINRNTDVPDGGCRNSTVCQYDKKNKTKTFELGHFGSAKFGQYDSETKSITLTYFGTFQGTGTRWIKIDLTCDEHGSVAIAEYFDVQSSIFQRGAFETTIKTKAACPRSATDSTSSCIIPTSSHSTPTSSRITPTSSRIIRTSSRRTSPSRRITPTSSHIIPTSSHIIPASSRRTSTSRITPTSSRITPTSSHIIPSSRGGVSSDGGLKTVYIVLIVVAGLLTFAVGSYAARKIVVRRKRGLLLQEEENEDYGTVPRLQIQNALSKPVSGPV